MVQTREGRFVRPLGARTPLHGGETAAPRLDALVRLDRRPLSEIVADTASGASTSFADVFVFDHNRLVEMGGQAQPPGPNGRAFPYSGSVTHENAVDCVGGAQSGILVASGAGASGHHLTLTRQFFRVEGTEFNLIPGRTQEIRLRNERALGGLASRFPEFARGPFRSCSR